MRTKEEITKEIEDYTKWAEEAKNELKEAGYEN